MYDISYIAITVFGISYVLLDLQSKTGWDVFLHIY